MGDGTSATPATPAPRGTPTTPAARRQVPGRDHADGVAHAVQLQRHQVLHKGGRPGEGRHCAAAAARGRRVRCGRRARGPAAL
eukprot:366331-Chlamydomonas_euryale.AAC.16